jgi:ubiquitin-conjugating enzyme E2 variant
VIEILACVLVADFITGLIHWFEDTYAIPFWQPVDDLIVHPNILHHADPLHFTMGSVLYRNYHTFALAGLVMLIAWPLGYLTWQFALIAVLASMGNEIHAWSHKRPSNTLIRLLQDMKLLISPEQHAKHHRKPYDKCYCTITNWVNPILDGIQFWRALEFCIGLIGIKTKRLSPERSGF